MSLLNRFREMYDKRERVKEKVKEMVESDVFKFFVKEGLISFGEIRLGAWDRMDPKRLGRSIT